MGPRVVLVVVVVASLVLGTVIALTITREQLPEPAQPSAAGGEPIDQPTETSGSIEPSPGVTSTSGPSGRPIQPVSPPLAPPPPAAADLNPNADPDQVVRNFLVGFNEFNWNDQPTPLASQLERARPWVTSDYFSALSEIREPLFLTSQRIAQRETQRVSEIVDCELGSQSKTQTYRKYRCTFILQTQSDTKPVSGIGPIWDIALVKRGDKWLVDGYQA